MITHAAPQKHYTVLLSRPVRRCVFYGINWCLSCQSLPLGEGAPVRTLGRMREIMATLKPTIMGIEKKISTLISQKSKIFASFPQGKPFAPLCGARRRHASALQS